MSKNILVLGGTRFFGKHLVQQLLSSGENVTLATRGVTKDSFGNQVKRIVFDRTSKESIQKTLSDSAFDVVYDNIAYTSVDVDNLLSSIHCHRYIVTSSTAVYPVLHLNTVEEDFDSSDQPYRLVNRDETDYAEGKRSLERILTQKYASVDAVIVRFPYVVGLDDYTKRLRFYIQHTLNQQPVHCDNFENQMSFVSSEEAGAFLAFLSTCSFTGAINGASKGTVSVKNVSDYISTQTGKGILLNPFATAAPYNGTPEYSINTEKAHTLGFDFSDIHHWLFQLIDAEIKPH
ncbi:NAD-dependent epimerase/dehydratase family protein [Enterococcus sp. LJL51]|uniref:NAD-dependent epimerase/dehydratase family protein n=1 Tax=Enterococcus sp. LJL51 TaxID=3416656 RepID=UPI003CF57125